MQASLFEFRHRWRVIFLIFTLAFSCYSVDPVNAGAATVNWIAERLGTVPRHNSYRIIFAIAAVLVFLAAWLRSWGTSYLKAEVMSDSRIHTERLLADGPYRYVRNPLYLGNILMAVGVGLMTSRTGFWVLSIGITLFILRLILCEEAELLSAQGESYRRYCAAVPRLFPSLAPRVPPAGNVLHWREGVRSELMYWLMAAALAVFAATLNVQLFYWFFSGALAVHLIVRAAMSRRSPHLDN